ncbi:MAG: hypothetical protein JWM62_1905 [Frankiales bacterium]|jgi:type VI secretion system secreted protein Hcp|nr:hypothetical protein [Frankiales bacterium]
MNRLLAFATSVLGVGALAGGVGLMTTSTAAAVPPGLEPGPRITLSGGFGVPGFLSCTGPGRAGDLDGDGVADEIVVDALEYDVASSRDAASGQASGKRQYQPLLIIKREVSPVSGAWSRLHASGTELSCTVKYTATGTYSDGSARGPITLTMTGVTVTGHEVFLGDTRLSDDGPLGMHEQVELTARKANWDLATLKKP